MFACHPVISRLLNPEQFTTLVLAYPGNLKKAVKRALIFLCFQPYVQYKCQCIFYKCVCDNLVHSRNPKSGDIRPAMYRPKCEASSHPIEKIFSLHFSNSGSIL